MHVYDALLYGENKESIYLSIYPSFILQLQTSGSERQEIYFEDDVVARQVP